MLLLTSILVFCFVCFTNAGPGTRVLSDLLFTAAGPYTYTHSTGGGSYNDGTIGKADDVFNSLEGGDFRCRDLVTHFLRLQVSSSISGSHCVTAEFHFTADTTGASGVAYGDVAYFQLQFRNKTSENGANCSGLCPAGTCPGRGKGKYGVDCGYFSTNNNEYASYVPGSKYFTAPMYSSNDADMHFSIKVCGLEAGEVIILRIDAQIYCQPNSDPSGNLQAKIQSFVDDNGNNYNGAYTVPLQGVNAIIGATGCNPVGTNPVSAADFNATITVFKPTQTSGGSYNMFIWYSWSKGAYRIQTFGTTNFTEVHTFDTECSFLHDGTVMYTQATCGCQATFISNTQPQLFFSVNSSYYNPVPTSASLVQNGVTYQVWKYERIDVASSVTQLYILKSDNKTIIRAEFYDGEYWLFTNYKQGDQATSNFQVAGGTNNATQCLCKKALDIMVVVERTYRVTQSEWAAAAVFVSKSLPDFTSTCTAPAAPAFIGQFGFNDPTNPTNCIPGVNYGQSYYDSTGVNTLMKFQSGGVRGTNAQNCLIIGAQACVGSDADHCGVGAGNVVAAINAGAQTLYDSDRLAASKVLLLVNKGIEGANPVLVAQAVANATARGIAVFAVTYYSTEFVSDMKVMVADPDNFVYRSTTAELTVENFYWPIEIVSKMCTPSALPCGTCCGQCEPTCGQCLTTPLNCPPSTNCSYTSKNTAAGCCYIDYTASTCPPRLNQCHYPPVCNPATGNCTYTNSCGVQSGDEPNCYTYSCVPNATDPTGQYICQSTPRFNTSNACAPQSCVNNQIVTTSVNCTPSNNRCFTATCYPNLNGACVLDTPVAPPSGWNTSNECNKCDAQTGYYTTTCPTSSDLCNPLFCNPNTGECQPKPIVCNTNATMGLCNNPICEDGVCVDKLKTCTSPGTCKICSSTLFGQAGCCNPATGNCSYTSKVCTGLGCPCGRPLEVCSNDVCVCPDTCSPTPAPTPFPTAAPLAPNQPPVDTPAPTPAPTNGCLLCNPPNQCAQESCDPSIGLCVAQTTNCTQRLIDEGVYGTCIENILCDPVQGCTYTRKTCTTGDICNGEIADNTFPGCCRPYVKPCPALPCFSLKCSVLDEGCILDQFTCPTSANKCKIPVCATNGSTCTFNNVVCENVDTACIVYTCNSTTGECDAKAKQSCDDNDACTIDGCDAQTGCFHTPIDCPASSSECDKDPVCNPTTGFCETTPIVCDDGIICTDDTCDAVAGCVYTVNDQSCADTNPCVNSSVCTATGCQATFVDCGGQGLFCSTHYCEDYFGCTVQPTNCQANATNDTCSYANCSEALRACETIEKPCLAFLGVVAGLVVAGVVIGVVAAALLIAGAAAGGGAAAVSQNYGHDHGHHVNVNPLYNHQTKVATGLN